jgi:hypothetical protein
VSAPPIGYTTTLLVGLAGLLAAEGVGVYDPAAVIPPGSTGIFRGAMPPDPDRAVALTAYPVEDGGGLDAITGVQARMRAGRDLGAVDDLADAVFVALHMREHFALGPVHVALAWRQSQAWIGLDSRQRMELTANYYFRTTRPGPFQHE